MAVAKRAPTRRARLSTSGLADLPSPGGVKSGLRERKKQKTRESIQRTALRLFEKQGYEETTVEQIAAAAEISPSTFFNYFPTKEDVVLYDAYDPVAIRMFMERPKDEPLEIGLREVLKNLAALFESDERMILARGRFFFEVPALRARLWDEACGTNSNGCRYSSWRCWRSGPAEALTTSSYASRRGSSLLRSWRRARSGCRATVGMASQTWPTAPSLSLNQAPAYVRRVAPSPELAAAPNSLQKAPPSSPGPPIRPLRFVLESWHPSNTPA